MNSIKGIITRKFGLKLRMERLKRKLSQEQIAELANLSKNAVGAIERGESSPTLETINHLAIALGMEVSDLVDVNKVDL